MKNRHATSLTEIMMAVVILGFIIVPIMQLLSYTNRGTREQEAEGIAANLAKEEMNRLMYILNRENLGSSGVWSFGENYNVKGNCFTGTYLVEYFKNSELDFEVPEFTFHDPVNCSTGKESNPSATYPGGSSNKINVSKLLPDADAMMADIKLTVRWKLPSGSYDDTKMLVLMARRAFIE